MPYYLTPKTPVPGWLQRLITRTMSPVSKIEGWAFRGNDWVDGCVLILDTIGGVSGHWTGHRNLISQSTWTCVWTPMSIWFRLAVGLLSRLAVFVFQVRAQRLATEREARELAGEVKWTSLYDLRRVLRVALGEARRSFPKPAHPRPPATRAVNYFALSEGQMREIVEKHGGTLPQAPTRKPLQK